jgi:AcrR family transcriptional regulator
MTAKASPRRRPGRPLASERPGDSSRLELLEAAAELFAEAGFEGTSVRQICERAGLAKGTFYWNFDSKQALFLALVDERIERPIRAAIEALGRGSAQRDMSEEANRRLVEAMQADRLAVVLDDEYWRQALHDPRLRGRYRRRQRELRQALTDALEARRRVLGGPPFPTPPNHLAIAFLSLASGIARSRVIDDAAMPDQLFGEMLALVYAGLVARAGEAPSA